MRRTTLPLAALAASSALLWAPSALAQSPPIAPIGPNQFFNGLVNGSGANAIIRMACFGPEPVGGRLGHPFARQSVSVGGPLASGPGFTGLADSIGATLYFPTPTSTMPPGGVHLALLRYYNEPAPISTQDEFPCSGSGEAVFAPVMGGEKARAATVRVSFVGQP